VSDLDTLIDLLPQKPPFLFLDRVLEVEPFRHIVGSKTFQTGHPIFENHLPGEPLVPGVILVEALAQLAGLALVGAEGRPIRGYLAEVTRMRFQRLVHPDEEIILRAELEQAFGPFARFAARASVGEETAAEGTITLARKGQNLFQ
jgi:3-hydroxyacyl-[acyl-carrier-protein] dehydratase